jgi:hypothetical protein
MLTEWLIPKSNLPYSLLTIQNGVMAMPYASWIKTTRPDCGQSYIPCCATSRPMTSPRRCLPARIGRGELEVRRLGFAGCFEPHAHA